MDGIRFILEDPQAANNRQKKRSRLVTACDTCRAKKIKCHQSPSSAKCEACRLSKSACRFRDRERYHAQRSGSLSASSSTFPSDSEDAHSLTDSPNHLARRATLPTLTHFSNQGHSRSSSLPPALRLPAGTIADVVARRAGSPSSEVGPHRIRKSSSRRHAFHGAAMERMYMQELRHSTPAVVIASPLSNLRNMSLDDRPADVTVYFDPLKPGFPAADHLEHCIGVFFDSFGARFPFLHREEVERSRTEQTMSAHQANCLVALALRFSSSMDNTGTARDHLGDPYLEMAKDLIVPAMYSPSVDTLHSLLLLSWGEYGAGREQGLNLYVALAVQMALELGLGNEETLQGFSPEYDQTDLRQTWWSLVILDIISSWVTGNPPNLNIQNCSTALPSSPQLSPGTSPSPTLIYLTLHELLALRETLLQITNYSYHLRTQPNENDLQELRTRLLSIHQSLPSRLEFNAANMRRAIEDHQELAFSTLHLILSSLIAITHCPLVFRTLPSPTVLVSDATTSAARTIIDVIVMTDAIDNRVVTTCPFLDLPLALAARAFALKSMSEQELTPLQEQASLTKGRFAEVSLGVCNTLLGRLAEFWSNVRNTEMIVQTGSVWTFVTPVQQSPVAIPSALGLQGVETYQTHMDLPNLHVDSDEQAELALTYSDSDLSREPSPMLFDFPTMLNVSGSHQAVEADQHHRASSDPTPTTLLPPISFAAGYAGTYDVLSSTVSSFSEEGHPSATQEVDYFSSMHASDCLHPSMYDGDGSQDSQGASSFPSSPWLIS